VYLKFYHHSWLQGYTMPSTSSELGEALQPDSTLKDVSEINWSFDTDDSLPFPDASGDPSGMPAPGKAVPHRTACISCPTPRYRQDDGSECASTTHVCNQPAAKRKAPSDDPDPDRHVARKVVINLDGESDNDSDQDTLSVPPPELAEDDYESIKAMVDADNQVHLASHSLSY
jgi:hypothetical protein